MRSYQVNAFGRPLVPAERETPRPAGTEVLMRVAACGVCHSDVHLWQGYFDLGDDRKLYSPPPEALPFTPGHEIVGEVIALGADADGVGIGDRRVVFPWIGCGQCPVCGAGNEHLCNRPRALGINVAGGYSDHCLVPHPRYLFAYDGILEELACTYACSGLTAFSALKKIGRLGDGESLVIVGAGGVGLAGIRFAEAVTGVAPIAVDIDDGKLAAASEAGAGGTLNATAEGAAKELRRMTGGGAAAVIDFVGSNRSASFGDRALRKGGTLVIVGLFGGSLTLPLPLIPLRAVTLTGSYVGSLAEMEELMALVRGGIVAPMPLGERRLDQATSVLEDLRDGRIVGRVVLRP